MASAVLTQTHRKVIFSKTEQDVLRVLLYFDIFKHPLSASELCLFFPAKPIVLEEVQNALALLCAKGVLRQLDGFYFLGSTSSTCVAERKEKSKRAAGRMKIASIVGRAIGSFPFVRGVMLSGELSKGVAGTEGDIDFCIVTKPGRLWICRTVLIVFKKIFLFNSKKYFCLNHFVAEDFLRVESRNVYTALELLTLKPFDSSGLHSAYLKENPWAAEYFPNIPVAGNTVHHSPKRHVLRNLLESLLPSRVADVLEHRLMLMWQHVWERRYHSLSPPERRHMYQCQPGISTAYGQDYQKKILRKYAYRLRRYGVPPVGGSN